MTNQDAVQAAFEAEVTQDDLNTWYQLQQELEKVKTAELQLRNKIFNYYFKDPKVGTNNQELSDGWILKGQYKLNYKIDEAMLTTRAQQFREAGIAIEQVVKAKPEFVKKGYDALTDEQRKLFDEVLEIKPGTPSLEIILPKRKT